MNKFFRVLGLGLMIATFAFVGFAQERTRDVVYKQYTDNFQSKEAAKLQLALDAAKEYVANFNTPDDEAQVKYFNDAIPTLEKAIQVAKDGDKADAESKEWYALLGKVTAAVKNKNWAEAFSSGKQAIDKQLQYVPAETYKPQKLDIAITLGTIGFDRAVEKTDTFNNEAINYLKSAIQQIEAGQTSTYGKVLNYDLKNKDNALGLMNYYIGYIMYYRQQKEKDALPYLYKGTQYSAASKDFSDIYRMIGKNYYDKIAELDQDRLAKITANANADNEETLALLAKEKGYADRGIDAYARALKLANDNPKASSEYKAGLRASLEEIYKFRFDKTDGIDSYVSTVMNKPFPDPATPVQPVVEEKKTEPTDTTTGTTSTTPSTKPATTMATKPAAAAKTSTTEAKTTTSAKKPRRR